MGKRLFMSLLSFTLIWGAVYAAADKKIAIKTDDGVYGRSLSELRCVKLNDGVMLLNFHDGTSLSWDTDKVLCVTLSGESGGNTTYLGTLSATPLLNIAGSKLVVRTASRQALLLYSVDGKLLHSASCCGEETIDLSGFTAGVFIVNINGNIYKIIHR